jgi:hypothetical protein
LGQRNSLSKMLKMQILSIFMQGAASIYCNVHVLVKVTKKVNATSTVAGLAQVASCTCVRTAFYCVEVIFWVDVITIRAQ